MILQKTNIFSSGGHSTVEGQDRGAIGNGYVEGIEAAKLRNIVVENFECLGYTVIPDQDEMVSGASARYFRNLIKKTTGDDLVIDIHFNSSSNPKATGVECIVRKEFTQREKDLGVSISKAISEVLQIKDRGLKTEAQTARKTLYLFEQIGKFDATAILIEVCFISNPNDMNSYIQKTAEVGKAITDTSHKQIQKWHIK